MQLTLLYKKHFYEILVSFENEPMSFNKLEKTLSAYPDTLNKRLKELVKYNLIEPTVHVENGKNRIKHQLTPKSQQLMPKLKEFIKLTEELESEILL